MKYYIDFDNTLFNTPLLIKNMLTLITNDIVFNNKNLSFNEIYEECSEMFNREHIYNIYTLISHFSKKYNLNLTKLTQKINNQLANSKQFVYDDSILFLKQLKKLGHSLFLLSYCPDSLKYHSNKISGSGLIDFFDAIFITSIPKYELDIDFKEGIFIDDNPKDLLGLYSKNPFKVIRIRRIDNKYSKIDFDNKNIEEYSNLKEIKIR